MEIVVGGVLFIVYFAGFDGISGLALSAPPPIPIAINLRFKPVFLKSKCKM